MTTDRPRSTRAERCASCAWSSRYPPNSVEYVMRIASFFDRGRRVSKVRPSHRKLIMESLSERCAPSGLVATTDAPDASEQPAEVSDTQESHGDLDQAARSDSS